MTQVMLLASFLLGRRFTCSKFCISSWKCKRSHICYVSAQLNSYFPLFFYMIVGKCILIWIHALNKVNFCTCIFIVSLLRSYCWFVNCLYFFGVDCLLLLSADMSDINSRYLSSGAFASREYPGSTCRGTGKTFSLYPWYFIFFFKYFIDYVLCFLFLYSLSVNDILVRLDVFS